MFPKCLCHCHSHIFCYAISPHHSHPPGSKVSWSVFQKWETQLPIKLSWDWDRCLTVLWQVALWPQYAKPVPAQGLKSKIHQIMLILVILEVEWILQWVEFDLCTHQCRRSMDEQQDGCTQGLERTIWSQQTSQAKSTKTLHIVKSPHTKLDEFFEFFQTGARRGWGGGHFLTLH